MDQISYNGQLASADGRQALYITERCVFRLTDDGLELIEVAPGIDVQKTSLIKWNSPPWSLTPLKK